MSIPALSVQDMTRFILVLNLPGLSCLLGYLYTLSLNSY